NVADTTKRIAQEFVVNESVNVLAGFGLTPLALATARVATEAKVPMVVMGAATAIIPDRSPYIVRTSQVTSQTTLRIPGGPPKNGSKGAVPLGPVYGPGVDIEKSFTERFKAGGGEVIEQTRAPLPTPDFAPPLQRVQDLKPEGLFVFVPSGVGA